MAGEAFHGGVVRPGEIARARPLDFDHAGTKVGQLPRRERHGDRLLQGHDRDSLQGQ